MTKLCVKCGEVKPTCDFNKKRNANDGLFPYCKNCRREYNRARRDNPSERSQQLRRESSARFKVAHPNYDAEYRAANKFKVAARKALNNSIACGNTIKPERCDECELPFPANEIEGHHDDYTTPLMVDWLCRKCHGIRHRQLNDAARLAA